MDAIPTLSIDLITQLRDHFKPKPQAELYKLPPVDLAYYAGEQSVVEYLVMRHEQAKEELNTNVLGEDAEGTG